MFLQVFQPQMKKLIFIQLFLRFACGHPVKLQNDIIYAKMKGAAYLLSFFDDNQNYVQ